MRKVIVGILFVVLLTGGTTATAALVDNGNGTVADTETGLMWKMETEPGTYTWAQALSRCENLEYPATNGYTDWRLPNRNELHTLVDYSRYNPAIDPLLETNTMSSYYWSSTTSAYGTYYAWRVYFGPGGVGYGYKSNSYYVRAVRAGQSGLLGDLVIFPGRSTGYPALPPQTRT